MPNLRSNFTFRVKYFYCVPIFLGTFSLHGCLPVEPTLSSPSPSIVSVTSVQPKWVYETSKEGKTGGVGISKPHFNGKTAQRSLAISRALDEIARQMGVEVNSIQKISTVGTSQNATTTLESYSLHSTNGKVVIARVESFWEDKATDELYVWMVVQ